MSSLVIVKVVPTLKLRIKLSIHTSVDKLNTPSSPSPSNIILTINDIPHTPTSSHSNIVEISADKNTPDKNTPDENTLGENTPGENTPGENISDENTPDKLTTTSPIYYNEQFVSFIIMFPFNFNTQKSSGDKINCDSKNSSGDKINCDSKNSSGDKMLIGSNILSNKNITPTYKINCTKDFKYKKFIRDKIRSDFNYKNKDISIIKSINVYKNYHNYVVILNNNSIRHKQYPNIINCVDDVITWRQLYDCYDPSHQSCKMCDISFKEIYEYLSIHSKLDIYYTDDLHENYISMPNIYNSLKHIV